MKIDISKKYLRKVNTIQICSTKTNLDRRPKTFKNLKVHILIDPKGGRYYLNPFEKELEKETQEIKVIICFIGGLGSLDNRTQLQKIAMEYAIMDVIYWMDSERLDLERLKIKGKEIGFYPEKEYHETIKLMGYKRK